MTSHRDRFGQQLILETIAELKLTATYVGWDFATPIWRNDTTINGFNTPVLEAFKTLDIKPNSYYTQRILDSLL